jgi:DNA-binding transcriptional MerR regulator
VNAERASRLLSIGEFAAATQLTPKALRLYDEQRLLPPASIDATNGYRYYSRAQVQLGRMIRTLRDMNLPLEEIAAVVTAEGARAEMLLRHFALELDRRFAREKRALQAALMLMRASPRGDAPAIVERARDAMTVAVSAFTATRERLVELYQMQLARTRDAVVRAGLSPSAEGYCALIDPVSDEEGRLEVLLPLAPPSAVPEGVTLRHMPAAACAVWSVSTSDAHASEFTGALDALFDWFDRHGYRAMEVPLASIAMRDAGLQSHILWAYELNPPPE